MRAPAVLLISPGILKWTDRDFGLPHLVALGGYLRAHTGVRVEILDLNYEGGDHNDLVRTLDELGPYLLVGLSCYSSMDYRRVLALGRFLKARLPDVPLISGGYHASALPGDLVFEGSPFDGVVVGEGELPVRGLVEHLLGGGTFEGGVLQRSLPEDLDALPPYQWDLLDRYWPRAHDIGRKLQIYLSRGCPYRCTFCMERAKSGYSWRAYSPERAVDELRRLASVTDLSRWLVNIADPLFGFQRRWRREVLEGIVRHGLLPRGYWTLTRSDDLDDPDFELLGQARFAIGIGLESGSPAMLRRMHKGNQPGRYLDAVRRLARRSHDHGLTWAVNVIVGHPSETPETLEETLAFVTELFASTPQTRGWLSVDPFRLYPGSEVHQNMDGWEAQHGARFYHRRWWTSWYDGPLRAQHLDPSDTLDFAERVSFMFERYPPLLADIQARFRGQGRDIDRVFEHSIAGQVRHLVPERRDQLLAFASSARPAPTAPPLEVPIGLNLRDPWVRRREAAVRRLLDAGALRSGELVAALLDTPPQAWLPDDVARGFLEARTVPPEAEGVAPSVVALRALVLAVEALEPSEGEVVADLAARSGLLAALLSRLVGPDGRVQVVPHAPEWGAGLRLQLAPLRNVEVVDRPRGPLDRAIVAGALPRAASGWAELLAEGGRLVAFLGPRFRVQDLVSLTRRGDRLDERRLARVRVPVLGGPGGWVLRRLPEGMAARTRFVRREAPALLAHVLAHCDLGRDAASTFDATLPREPWVPALEAALDRSSDRLLVQVLGLRYEAVDGLLRALERDVEPVLAEALSAALRAEREGFTAGWEAGADALDAVAASVGPELDRLRGALWAHAEAPVPPLIVVDCPALGGAGRATRTAEGHVVAVSLREDPQHVLLQVLHEEMHPLSDPHVPGEGRDTRVGHPGHELHAQREALAVAACEAFLKARAPQLLEGFAVWRARAGVRGRCDTA